MSDLAPFTLPRSRPGSPAMQRINARAAEIDRERMEAEAILSRAKEKLGDVHRELAETNAALLDAVTRLQATRAQVATLSKGDLITVIKKDACRIFGISRTDLQCERRDVKFVIARFYAAQRMADELGMSFPAIGRSLGGRDHTTAMNMCNQTARIRVQSRLQQLGAVASV